MNLVTAAVLAAGVRLVDAILPPPTGGAADAGGSARVADDPGEIRDRLLRAAALGAVLLIARRAGRAAGGRGRARGRRRDG